MQRVARLSIVQQVHGQLQAGNLYPIYALSDDAATLIRIEKQVPVGTRSALAVQSYAIRASPMAIYIAFANLRRDHFLFRYL